MKKIIVILFLISIFFLSFLPVKDTDFGWHYRCGREFFTKKNLCLKNTFSYFLPNYQSANPHFLYDIGLALVYDHFGFNGLSVLYSLLMLAAAYLFIYFTSFSWLGIISFYLLFFLSLTVFGLGLRSQITSYLFFLLTLFILEKSEKKASFLFLLPLVFLIWVNTHIGFFLGPIIFFFYLINKLFKNNFSFSLSKFPLIIFIISLISTLINPFGFRVYFEIFNHLTSPMGHMIAEWVSPIWWQTGLIIFFTASIIFLFLKKRSLSLFQILLLLFFSLLALKERRNLPFFYTVFFYLLLKNKIFNNKITVFIDNLYLILFPLLITCVLFFLIINLPQTLTFNSSWNKYCSEGPNIYPCQAIKDYLPLSGNIFAMYEWGGFLIWQKPEIKVFVDGRMPAWKDEEGRSPYQVFLDIIQTQPGWNEKLNQLKTNFLLITNGTFLDLLLREKASQYDWQEKYRDINMVIYKNLTKKN
ncbi:hypothetical protein CO006_02370 [Candidatus Roizmanbacteria bacterium CG_4_8_14_3_um_filter_35_14]|nr:MAG: hypothetical protein CO006_02370 [Candidatus Roizmanbacteria bacterium CG_4_8_14_3_um_filter_35_14]